MKNKPYDKENSIGSLGSDLTTAVQDFHYSGERLKDIEGEKTKKHKQ